MKKIHLVIFVLVTFLMVTNMAYSEEKGNRIGIGVSMGKEFMLWGEGLTYSLLDFPCFYFPIKLSKLKIEPEIGFYRISETGDTHTFITFGVGIFGLTKKEKIEFYYGARFGLSCYFFDGDTELDYYVGPALGSEYFFSRNFSLGGEIQLNFLFLEDDLTLIKTKTLVFLRWYFK